MLATVVITLTSLSILWADGDVFMALLAAAILLVSIAPFLLPTRYTLTQREVIVQMPGWSKRRAWGDLRRWEEGKGGFFLSPFSKPRRFLDGRRGVSLRGGDQAAVRRAIVSKLGEGVVGDAS